MLERFKELFTGGDLSHGRWDQEKGAAVTVKGAAPLEAFQEHLAGTKGVGIVPVRSDGSCRFAAIDIDDDRIDHRQLYAEVTRRRFPLHVCRSKSGGAHLYLFMHEPGIGANVVVQTLRRWAHALGYGTSEVFPKQLRQAKQNFGNWINLPYFGSDATTRYCVGADGAMTLEQFLDSIVYFVGNEEVDEKVQDQPTAPLPPCLQVLTQDGTREGARNQVLFNMAVFYRKSQPEEWKNAVQRFNLDKMTPPMSNSEVQTIIRSANRKTYQYTCNQEPLCSNCSRKACLDTPFGVGYQPWREDGVDEPLLTNLRRITTDPPSWLVEVNGQDVRLETEHLTNPRRFKDRVFESLCEVVPLFNQQRWDRILSDLSQKRTDIAAPPDASPEGLFESVFQDFLSLTERAKSMEDLLRGYPFETKGKIYFRFEDLHRYASHKRIVQLPERKIFRMLHEMGCEYGLDRVKGKKVRTWRVPSDLRNSQTEDFDIKRTMDEMEKDSL